jgi:cytochrome P450 / NADPH-cytochrome P450 reductase
MAQVLKLSGRRSTRTQLQNMLYYWEERERLDNAAEMQDLVHQIIAERRAHPKPEAKDLLNTMLYSVDRETNETLGDKNVANNIITFLV